MKRFIIIITYAILTLSCYSQVYKFKSTYYDIEKPGEAGYTTKYEITYHTYDFNKSIVTFEGKTSKGTSTIVKYPFRISSNETNFQDGNWVLIVRQKGVKEIWFSTLYSNLGYDYDNGIRIAYYGLTQLK